MFHTARFRVFRDGVSAGRFRSRRPVSGAVAARAAGDPAKSLPLLLVVAGLSAVIGCAPEATFSFNAVYARRQENEVNAQIAPQHKRDIGDLLVAMFGTPDEPFVPELGGVEVNRVMDITKIRFAAGAVGRDEQQRQGGLYREHCAHCHGVTGDGAGPTAAFLNPYPRDYRMGVFKFKSTPKSYKPTHDDLMRVLMEGVAGTAMPSFRVLPENEVEALAHYVRYLSIRGEVERSLLSYAAAELEPEARLLDLEAGEEEKAEQIEIARGFVVEVVEKWINSESMATEVPAPDPDRVREQTIARGRDLFYGKIANCVECHGGGQLGDGQVTDYDDWTKELEPANAKALEEYLALGALPPRNILPRNLRMGIYRGGRRPIDLYWRIRNGIDGSPMPKAMMKPTPDSQGLTEEDLWCLIDYVRNLPYEPVSKAATPSPSFQRERM